MLNLIPGVLKQFLKDSNQHQNTQEQLSYREHAIKIEDSVIPIAHISCKQAYKILIKPKTERLTAQTHLAF